MLDHVALDVYDVERSSAFYSAVLAPLGLAVAATERNAAGGRVVLFGRPGQPPEFVILEGERPGTGNHIAFRAASEAEVRAFHAAGIEAGGMDNGAPGPRRRYAPDYYAAFLLDPDGFNVEAVCHFGS